jgi:NADPH2:quinone reductase
MQALVCESPTTLDDLLLKEVPEPQIRSDQVLVRVITCALNFPDVLMVQGKYQRKPPLPFSPGCEYSGIAERVGTNVTALRPGQSVCGTAWFGGLAQMIAANPADLYALPPDIDMDLAASFLFTYSTALYALRDRAGLKAGQSLLVLGAGGGIGLAAVELGKALGARVVAAASSDTKLALAREKGADMTLLYPLYPDDPVQQRGLREVFKERAGESGFDVICDPIGGCYAEPALRSIGWQGRYLVIGFAAGSIPRIPLNLALLKSCQIVGVLWGAAMQRDAAAKRRLQTELLQMLHEGYINPHIAATFPLARGIDALKMLAERRAAGKVIVHCQ